MSNLEKYNEIFVDVFGVSNEVLNDDFGKDTVEAWDSVHQLNLVAMLEEAFDLMLDPEDIMAFSSYKAGKEILVKQDISL